MARGRDGRVWVGERDGRIDKLDPRTGKVEHVLSGLRGDVLGMTQDEHERLWIAGAGRTLSLHQRQAAGAGRSE
jgi:hypothetical protein